MIVAHGVAPMIGRFTVVVASISRVSGAKTSEKLNEPVSANRNRNPAIMIVSPTRVVRNAFKPASFGVICFGFGYLRANQKPINR